MYPLIPIDKNGLFLISDEIWKIAIIGIYELEVVGNQFHIQKINMLIEAYWKVLLDQEVCYNQIVSNRVNLHWWEEFKREWKSCYTKDLSTNAAEKILY
ncbi:hypothetical protein RhiirA4_477587 [Rhizophagus irregularis]|uniref:Uncharacterized protein n=1 Tax=Rhizophagus irregularis TaxID=588596 RepID=A0A2I1HDG2_9GLOM|nr:hypothetical protein RhiirA4_477587 [Rhizophagus irregularis]